MSEPDRYSPPRADVRGAAALQPADIARLDRVASGQRILLVSLILTLAASFFSAALSARLPAELETMALVAALVGPIVGLFGVARLSGALRSHFLVRIFCLLSMLIPLLNLAVMASLSIRATRALRAAGYKVGLLGASRHADQP